MLGHNVPKVFMMVFGFGCGLAAIAGVIAGPALVTDPAMAAPLGPILFVVVVFGGLGSLPGAFISAMLIGQLGRASCRERVCQYVSLSGVGVSLKKKNKQT